MFSYSFNKFIAVLAFFIILFFILISPLQKGIHRTSDVTHINNRLPEPVAIVLPQFRDVTAFSNLLITHSQRGDQLSALDETLGAGACAFDYDNDHWIDLLIIAGSGQNHFYGKKEWWQQKSSYALFRNLGNGRFQNVTKQAGLLANEWGMGCNTADLDNDGDQDIVISNKGHNKLYRNNGDGRFTDVSEAAGFNDDASWSTSISIADYDQDGYLDIYTTNYVALKKGANTFERMKGYGDLLAATFDATLYDAQANKLYRNLGDLTFSEVGEALGVANASGRGLSSYWLDINQDHYPDLWVANDQGLPNQVYLNQQGKSFRAISASLRTNLAEGNATIASGDVNNDGVFDILLSSSNHYPPVLYQASEHFNEKQATDITTLYRDRSRSLGLANKEGISTYHWGMIMQDFNHNGWLDIMAASGYSTPDMDNPRITQGQQNNLWLNQGDGSFKPCLATRCGQAFQDRFSSRSLVSADFDNDGDIDVYVTNNNEAGQLLFNQTITTNRQQSPTSSSPHWLQITLLAQQGNRDALGSTITISIAEQKYVRRVDSATNFLSSGSKRVHFGLGKYAEIDELMIEWSDGTVQTFENIRTNQHLVITQGVADYQPIELRTEPKKRGIGIEGQAINTAMSAVEKLLILKRVLSKDKTDPLREWLETLAQHPQASIRKNVLQLAAITQTDNAFKLLIAGLFDVDEAVQLVAIEKIQHDEAEFSVRYLLRLFNAKSPKVRCAVTQAFAFFFREEEAMITKKYLALPAIIRLLQDPVADVRRCAAMALGDAESYRAVMPLVQRLNDESLSVRLAAIDALGLIRQRRAIPELLKLLEQSQHVEVLAQTLIALKRLNADTEAALLARPLQKKLLSKDYKSVEVILMAYEQLLADSVVMTPKTIAQTAWHWFSQQRVIDDDKHNYLQQKELYPSFLLMLNIIRLASYEEGIVLASRFLASEHDALKKSAYHTLVYFKQPEKFTSADTASFVSLPLKLKKLIYQNALELPLTIPLSILKNDILRVELQQPIIRLLAKYPQLEAKMLLLSVSVDSLQTTSLRALALQSLSAHVLPSVDLPLSLYQDRDVLIRKQALAYWVKQQQHRPFIARMPEQIKWAIADKDLAIRLPAVLSLLKRPEVWATQVWKRHLYDKTVPLALRLTLVEALSQPVWQEEKEALLNIVNDKEDPLSSRLLELLISH